MHAHRDRVAEVEPLQRLRHDDRVQPVGREVHVVRVGYAHGLSAPAGPRVDRGEAVARVVVHPEGAEVPRGCHVLRVRTRPEVVDDLVRVRVDHVDRVALRVRHVDPLGVVTDGGREPVRLVGGVHVVLVQELRHHAALERVRELPLEPGQVRRVVLKLRDRPQARRLRPLGGAVGRQAAPGRGEGQARRRHQADDRARDHPAGSRTRTSPRTPLVSRPPTT